MIKQQQEYSDHFLKLTIREQYLIFITGVVVIFCIVFFLFIDAKIVENRKSIQQTARLQSSNQSLKVSTMEMQAALEQDPNEDIRNKITQYEAKLAKIDEKLLTLTSELISPVQMRYALLDLLKLEKGVSLLSFELLGAQPLLSSNSSQVTLPSENLVEEQDKSERVLSPVGLSLYRHGIKIKLSGSYFDLRNYLFQLENLSWKFFWQDFNFKLTQYPKNELEIEMYSLGTKKEFVGV